MIYFKCTVRQQSKTVNFNAVSASILMEKKGIHMLGALSIKLGLITEKQSTFLLQHNNIITVSSDTV
jgi:hypothetical protein